MEDVGGSEVRGVIPRGAGVRRRPVTPPPSRETIPMLAVAVRNDKQNLQLTHASGVLEFGRGPQRGGTARCTIDDAWVSRDHVHVEELSGGRVLVRNLSQRAAIELSDGT